MNSSKLRTPPAVLLLADHLDLVLAAGEDMMKLEVDIEAVRRADGVAAPWERFADLVAKAQLYELTIVSRVLQARNRAKDMVSQIGVDAGQFERLLDLFASGTAVLEDAVAELAQRAGGDFDTGLDAMAYLRTRGVIPAEAGTLAGVRMLGVGETFLIARRIELGPLLDLTAALLDLLDVAYGLFDETEAARDERAGGSAVSISSQDSDAPRQAAGT